MIIFIIISAILYIVASIAVYNTMHAYEKKDRYIFIISSFFIMYLITAIIVSLSSKNINIDNINIVNLKIANKATRLIFAPINSFEGIGLLGIILNKIKCEEDRKKIIIRSIVFIIVCIILLILEKGYITNFIGNLLKNVV